MLPRRRRCSWTARLEALYSEVQLYRENRGAAAGYQHLLPNRWRRRAPWNLMFLADHVARSLRQRFGGTPHLPAWHRRRRQEGRWDVACTDLAKVIGLEANQLPEPMPELSVVGYRGTTAVMRRQP